MQVDPIKPTFKAPGSIPSKLRYDGPVSDFAFNLNLRRHTPEVIEEEEAFADQTDGKGLNTGSQLEADQMVWRLNPKP